MHTASIFSAVNTYATTPASVSANTGLMSHLRCICKAWHTVVFLFCLIPAHAFAAIIFEFESSCTDFIRNTECAYFGLESSDTVTGGFIVEDQFGAPGAISTLNNDQYQLIFTFGNQTFTEQDATGPLSFLVSLDGSGFSSILGNFQNSNVARLTFLTLTTVNIELDGHEADTFGGGG